MDVNRTCHGVLSPACLHSYQYIPRSTSPRPFVRPRLFFSLLLSSFKKLPPLPVPNITIMANQKFAKIMAISIPLHKPAPPPCPRNPFVNRHQGKLKPLVHPSRHVPVANGGLGWVMFVRGRWG